MFKHNWRLIDQLLPSYNFLWQWYVRHLLFHFCQLWAIKPRPPEVFFVTRPPKGGCCNPLPGFSIRNAWYPYIYYQYIGMDLLYPFDTKMSTIELHMTSLWRHKVSAPSDLDALKIYVKMSKNQFFAKKKKNKKSWKHGIFAKFSAEYVRRWWFPST